MPPPGSFTAMKLQLDPEEAAFEERQSRLRDEIARLKAHRAVLDREFARLKWIIEKKNEAKPAELDWLCYLPSTAGSLSLIHRAADYLEKMRLRVGALHGRMWLCADHDCATPIFLISIFRVFNDSVFCSGQWTDEGRKSRHLFKGVSPDMIALAGDPDLISEIDVPADCLTLAALPEQVRGSANSPQVFGLAGAVCLSIVPAYGISGIYRRADH
jgi:hypothetical protein